MSRVYGNGTNSSIGADQFNDFYWQKKALIESRKDQYFMQLSDTTNLPKHMGKTIKRYHYLPLLDDANINDQGIDAAGLQTNYKATIVLQPPGATASTNGENLIFITGEGASASAALTDAKTQAKLEAEVQKAGYNVVAWNIDWNTTITDYINDGWKVSDDVTASGDQVDGFPYVAPVFDGSNLYGSSKDVGTIQAKLPALSEASGRVNRVGFKRKQLEGSIQRMGFFDEYTSESVNFDSDAELMMHINREMVNGAVEMTEDALQIDLLNGAGVVRYGGVATSTDTLTGASGDIPSLPTYEDIMKLNIDLDNNRCPKDTEIVTGSRNIDTKPVNSARIMYIGSELITTVKKMKGIDGVNGSGFVSVEKYASAGNLLRGEIGQVDQMKIIVVPEMMHWAGEGKAEGTNDGYRATGGNYDVFPMLVVGSKSFTTIGFQTDGKSTKFKIKHSKPGDDISYGHHDPYGDKGFMSINWYYGTMILRPEHIALYKVVAPW